MHNSLLCSFAPNPLLELTLPIRRREVFPLPLEPHSDPPEISFTPPMCHPLRGVPGLKAAVSVPLPGHPPKRRNRVPATGG